MRVLKDLNMTVREGKLNYFRSLLFLGLLAFPMWSFLYEGAFLSARVFFGLAGGLVLAASFHSEWMRHNLERIVYGLMYLGTITINIKLYSTSLDPLWAIYHISTFVGISVMFRKIKFLVIFFVLYTISTYVASFLIEEPGIEVYKFLFLYTVSTIIMAIIASSYRWTIMKIEKLRPS